jgi:hypothetical protein
MAGARKVTASETEAQATWAEWQIKELTDNETPISARHPHTQPFTYWRGLRGAIDSVAEIVPIVWTGYGDGSGTAQPPLRL